MGTGTGPGFGTGAGNGYSARRSTLQNVGLYGNLPTTGSPAAGTGMSAKPRPGQPGESGSSGGGQTRPAAPMQQGKTNVGGAADTTVPAPYRRKVAEYFQRIAEETGGK